MKAVVHTRQIVDEAGAADVERLAFCSRKQATVVLEVCEACPQFRRLAEEGDGKAVICENTPTERDIRRDRLERNFELSELALRVQVGELMSRVVTCVKPSVAASAVRSLLAEQGAACAPVVGDTGVLLGVITPAQLLIAPASASAAECMIPAAVGIPDDAPLTHAIATMAQTRTQAIPVLAGDGSVIGTIGALEVMRFFSKRWGYDPADE